MLLYKSFTIIKYKKKVNDNMGNNIEAYYYDYTIEIHLIIFIYKSMNNFY